MSLHNLRIIVMDGGKAQSYQSIGNKSESTIKNENKNSVLYKVLNAKQTIKSKVESGMSPSSVFAMNMGLQICSQIVRQTANYYISDIGRKNGDNNYQAMINRQIEIVTDTMNIGNSILSGASAGAMFGIGGAVVGALIGAVGSAVSTGFKYAERQRTYGHEMFKQNTSQVYNLTRANYSALNGRLR